MGDINVTLNNERIYNSICIIDAALTWVFRRKKDSINFET